MSCLHLGPAPLQEAFSTVGGDRTGDITGHTPPATAPETSLPDDGRLGQSSIKVPELRAGSAGLCRHRMRLPQAGLIESAGLVFLFLFWRCPALPIQHTDGSHAEIAFAGLR